MLIRMAWRNVWRNKTRSLVILTAVTLGLWGGIFSDAFMQGMAEQQIYSAIHTETGHIQLNKPGFLLNHDMQLHLDSTETMAQQLRSRPDVEGVSTTIQLTGMASTASGSSGVMVNGIEPEHQQQVSDLSGLLVDGNYFAGDRSNPVVVGQQLADKLKVKLHSRIVLTLQTYTGDIIYGAFRITGIFRTHDSDFDKQMLFVQQKDLRRLIGFPDNAASLVTVLLRQTESTDPVADSLRAAYPGLQVQTWIELSPMLQVLSGTMIQMTLIFVGIILIALAFGIVNTMLMAVLDRVREIGMLLSVGMKPSRVFGMIMLETVFLSLTGAAVGVLLSIATIAWTGKTGINLAFFAEGFNAMGYSSVVYPTLGADFYIMLTGMVIVVALVAGLFPARHAVRLKPAEAVRGE